jgi:putative transposase
MSTKYKFWDSGRVYFVTFSVVEWIDVFTRNEYREIVVNSLQYCISNKGLNVHAWVIMSNHVHLLISLQDNTTNTFSDIMRDMKKYTAMHIIKAMRENPQESRKDWLLNMLLKAGKSNPNNTNFQLWRQDNHPIQITDGAHYNNTLHYIHQNPVLAGWVHQQEHYPWSSAADYAGQQGVLPVVVL